MGTYRVEDSGLITARIVGSKFNRIVLVRQMSEKPTLERMVKRLNSLEAKAGYLTRDEEDRICEGVS